MLNLLGKIAGPLAGGFVASQALTQIGEQRERFGRAYYGKTGYGSPYKVGGEIASVLGTIGAVGLPVASLLGANKALFGGAAGLGTKGAATLAQAGTAVGKKGLSLAGKGLWGMAKFPFAKHRLPYTAGFGAVAGAQFLSAHGRSSYQGRIIPVDEGRARLRRATNNLPFGAHYGRTRSAL